jgi:hypothetical protein
MKYRIIRLDGRFSYRKWFEYYIGFSNNMAIGYGPLYFNDTVKWFTDTYGWSAEIRQYDKISKWVSNSQMIARQPSAFSLSSGILTELPDHCNPHWSWTNGYDDLRIYVKSAAELAFFQLKFPVDQK